MIRVDQTLFGVPHGNCFNACVASLLEIPLSDVPNLHAGEGNTNLLDYIAEFLYPRGFYPIALRLDSNGWTPAGLHILSGKSPRGDFLHSVIARGRQIVHDPHPSRAGILTREDVILFVPLDPTERSLKTS